MFFKQRIPNVLSKLFYIGENGGISRTLSRCNHNYVSLFSVYGTGLPGLNLYYSII